MLCRYFVDFQHGIAAFANFSQGIAVLGTLQCLPLCYLEYTKKFSDNMELYTYPNLDIACNKIISHKVGVTTKS